LGFHYPDAESPPNNNLDNTMNSPANVPLLTVLRERRSRRFGLGMKMPAGPLAYESRFSPVPLSEEEEGALVFAASGITGHALADLCYSADGGGGIMAGLVGRTIASGDALQTVALIVINDNATYLVRRPCELPPQRIEELIQLGRQNQFAEFYRSCRVKIKEGRTAAPIEPLFNINANRWSAHAKGTSYFLPINDLTCMYVNGLLEVLNESMGAFILDERNSYHPAGLSSFAKSKGGHLDDDPRRGRVVTVRQVEQFVNEFVTIEQGMMHQNLGLMAEALGLGGFPNFANHEFGWLEALGFRMQHMRASQYLGVNKFVALGMKLLKQDIDVPYAIGLERDGEVLLRPFCPPYCASMSEAVRAVVALKFGSGGIFRSHAAGSAWSNPGSVTNAVPPVSEKAIEATIAYCEYLWRRYGRFPVYLTPFRTVLGFQACHVDVEFYHKFYRPEALSSRQHEDFESRAASKGPPAA
jgi:hypothetical protein